MIKQHIVSKDNGGNVTSEFDSTDKRIYMRCDRCGSTDKLVRSFVMDDWTNTGKHREAHQLRCYKCNQLFCNLPFKLDQDSAGDFEMPFGKHKGKRLADVPSDYLDWLISQPFGDKIARRVRIMRGQQ